MGREARREGPSGPARAEFRRKEGRLQAGGSLLDLEGGCPARRASHALGHVGHNQLPLPPPPLAARPPLDTSWEFLAAHPLPTSLCSASGCRWGLGPHGSRALRAGDLGYGLLGDQPRAGDAPAAGRAWNRGLTPRAQTDNEGMGACQPSQQERKASRAWDQRTCVALASPCSYLRVSFLV